MNLNDIVELVMIYSFLNCYFWEIGDYVVVLVGDVLVEVDVEVVVYVLFF